MARIVFLDEQTTPQNPNNFTKIAFYFYDCGPQIVCLFIRKLENMRENFI